MGSRKTSCDGELGPKTAGNRVPGPSELRIGAPLDVPGRDQLDGSGNDMILLYNGRARRFVRSYYKPISRGRK